MSDDLVTRLLKLADENYEMLNNIHEPLLEAAYHIETLKAENERWRKALWKIAFDWHYDNPETALNVLTNIARAALAGEKKDD